MKIGELYDRRCLRLGVACGRGVCVIFYGAPGWGPLSRNGLIGRGSFAWLHSVQVADYIWRANIKLKNFKWT